MSSKLNPDEKQATAVSTAKKDKQPKTKNPSNDNQNKPKPTTSQPYEQVTPENSSPVAATSEASDTATTGKSKADLRRERALIQEAQRAKKAGEIKKPATVAAGAKSSTSNKPAASTSLQPSTSQTSSAKPVAQQVTGTSTAPSSSAGPNISSTGGGSSTSPVTLQLSRKKTESNENQSSVGGKHKLFHHCDQYKRDYSVTERLHMDSPVIHPAFIKLGLQLAHEVVSGSNARCIAFLAAFRHFIADYKAPDSATRPISKDLEVKLKPNINFLAQCRPLSISMANAIKEMKQVIAHFSSDISETEAKRRLNDELETFVHEKVLLAAVTICKYILANSEIVITGSSYSKSKIANGDCILTYGYSSLVLHILLQAQRHVQFEVVVVDSRPHLKGKEMLEQLCNHNISCTYVLINAVSFVMSRRVSKVLLGAHALLANGYVMSPIGSSQIALVAKSFNVPVVVCCETYKFCEKVQTDALINNELGNPYDLITTTAHERSPLSDLADGLASNENLTLLNLTYDVTPPELISCVVTDMGMLPCTSVPVVLRLKNSRDTTNYYASSSVSSNTASTKQQRAGGVSSKLTVSNDDENDED